MGEVISVVHILLIKEEKNLCNEIVFKSSFLLISRGLKITLITKYFKGFHAQERQKLLKTSI